MSTAIRLRLSIMMFLEFFIWGAWLPLSFSFIAKDGLNFAGWQQDLLNISFPISAILAMFLANQFVDRNFAAERFLAEMGRRKFVLPIFETLIGEGDWGRPIAERLYARTRTSYHSVTRERVDRLLQAH